MLKTREPWAMPHYRPHTPIAFLALLLAGRGEELIPIPLSTSSSFSTQIPGEQQRILCLFFALYPLSSLFLLAACVATPCLCLLPQFIVTGAVRGGAAASTRSEHSALHQLFAGACCSVTHLHHISYHIPKQPVLGVANDFHQSHLWSLTC